jgi:hypothetical protein
VLFPSEFEAPGEKIIGAEHLNRVMRGWLESIHGDTDGETDSWQKRLK